MILWITLQSYVSVESIHLVVDTTEIIILKFIDIFLYFCEARNRPHTACDGPRMTGTSPTLFRDGGAHDLSANLPSLDI